MFGMDILPPPSLNMKAPHSLEIPVKIYLTTKHLKEELLMNAQERREWE
jgi:hypothetical protein